MTLFNSPLLTDASIAEYAIEVQAMDNDAFVAEAAEQILSAGYHSKMSVADQKARVCYHDAGRRNAPHLYARAYNRAAGNAGVVLDASDFEQARAA